MAEIAQPIDLNLSDKLQDREYRQKFFLAEASADIARQLIALRKRRNLDQGQLAAMVGTQQPAISRIEKADYQNWSFNTLRKIAGAEDARIRVIIEPAEDVLPEYEVQSEIPLVVRHHGTIGTVSSQDVTLKGQMIRGGMVYTAVTEPAVVEAENINVVATNRYSIPVAGRAATWGASQTSILPYGLPNS